ncbi:MAG: TolC family protein [Aliidongia sp.]
MRIGILLALSGSLALTACDLAPDYHAPLVDVPASYKETGPWRPAEPSDTAARGPWWNRFGDETLDRLEPQIEAANPDLAAAAARFDKARAFAAEAEAGAYPQVVAGADFSANKQSADRPLRSSNSPNYYGANQIDAQASYEVDLWGKIRNEASAGRALAQASGADLASVRLSLQAELANDYFALRGFDADAQLLQDTVTAYQKARDLTDTLFKGKIVSSMDVSRARDAARQRPCPGLRHSREAGADGACDRRADRQAGRIVLASGPGSAVQAAEIPVGMPSTLLQRRPDIAEAERNVKAANAGIGVARAAFYPSLSFNLLGGTQGTNLSLLKAATASGRSGRTSPCRSSPAGCWMRRNRPPTPNSARRAPVTVRPCSPPLPRSRTISRCCAYSTRSRMTRMLRWSRHSTRSTSRLTSTSREPISYLEVVTAQTPLLQAQETALDLQTSRLQAAVALTRALGGGWDVSDLPAKNEASALAPNTTG